MIEIGDYVLLHRIKNVENTSLAGEPLPIWCRVEGHADDNYEFNVTMLHVNARGYWGADTDDVLPEHLVTDEQWAELAKWRLLSGINEDAADPD